MQKKLYSSCQTLSENDFVFYGCFVDLTLRIEFIRPPDHCDSKTEVTRKPLQFKEANP